MNNQKTLHFCPYTVHIKSSKYMLQPFNTTVQKFGVGKILEMFLKKSLLFRENTAKKKKI